MRPLGCKVSIQKYGHLIAEKHVKLLMELRQHQLVNDVEESRRIKVIGAIGPNGMFLYVKKIKRTEFGLTHLLSVFALQHVR